jgi:hypothetical protein
MRPSPSWGWRDLQFASACKTWRREHAGGRPPSLAARNPRQPEIPALKPAQIVRHVAEFLEQLGVAKFADHGVACPAERDRANAAR